MNNTALGAEKIIFISEAHEKFYYEKLKEVRYQDVYHKALCYCLGMNEDTRRNVDKIYNFKTGCVKPECLHEGWQTSGSAKVVRMAFNLYCNGTPSVDDEQDTEEQVDECRRYSVEDLFCCCYAPYFWQAIQIRYPEYATYNKNLYAMFGGNGEFVIGADSFGQLSSGIPNRILSGHMYWLIVAIVMGILFIITGLLIVGIGYQVGKIYRKYCWDIISIVEVITSTAIAIYFGDWIKSDISINLITLLLLVHVVYIWTLFCGSIQIRCNDRDFNIEAKGWNDYTGEYSQIDSISYEENGIAER